MLELSKKPVYYLKQTKEVTGRKLIIYLFSCCSFIIEQELLNRLKTDYGGK